MDTMDFKVNREIFTAGTVILDSSCEQSVERDFCAAGLLPGYFQNIKMPNYT